MTSLLPQQIPPQTTPVGKTDKNGNVTIDINWWLFLLNVSKQVLTVSPAASIVSTTYDLSVMTDSEAEIVDAVQDKRSLINAQLLQSDDMGDTAGIPARINNAQLLQIDQDVFPSLRDMVNISALSQDSLLTDPIPQAQPSSSVTVGVSPFTYTAPFSGLLSVTGGVVSAIAIIRQGTSVATGLTTGLIPVSRRDQVQITYTGLPTVNFLPT